MTFFAKKFEKSDFENFWGSLSIRWKWKEIKKKIFLMKLKIWNPYGLRISHIKFEWNRRQNFFSFSKGGPFGVFLIFKVSIWRYWSTFTDKNRGTDSLECLNSGVNGCLNIKNFIWEQVLGVSTTFWWAIKQKIRGGHNGPPR